MLTPNDPAIKTFQEYAQRVIIPYINFQFQACHRIDLVFDQYFSDSLKNAVREKRGSGTRWKVEPNVKLPKKWHDFLLDSQNKEELFTFLANTITNFKFIEGKQIYVTLKSRVLTNDVPMSDCSHEEADTRMLVHLRAALENGLTSFLVRTVDTDVIIILLGKYHGIRQVCSRLNLWVHFGVGKAVKNIHINATFEHLGAKVSRALPFFHAFTGSDTTSAFKFKAKKSAWQAWKTYRSITDVFEEMSQKPFSLIEKDSTNFQKIQKFVIQMYSSNLETASVDEARMLLFAQNQNMERIPPTCDALLHHAK